MLQLTLSDLQFRPPPQLLWIKRHYCPLMLEAMKQGNDITLSDWNVGYRTIWSSAGTSLTYRKNWGQSVDMYGQEMENDAVHITVVFYYPESNIIEHGKSLERVNVPLDDIHLLPYLFKITEMRVKRDECDHVFTEQAGQALSPWTTEEVLVVVPEHWRQLIRTGIVPRELHSA